MAGPGPTSPSAAWPFPFDEDWTLHQPEQGTSFAISPCTRLWTGFDPDPDHVRDGTWRIGASRHGGLPFGPVTWQVTFDATTPVELLHDVHADLLDLYHEDLHSDRDWLFEDVTAPHDAYVALFDSGWSHHVNTDGTQTFLSPDGLAGVRHQYATTGSNEPHWRVWGGHLSEPLWQAHFSSGTPIALVASLTASMICIEPLNRTADEVPSPTRYLHLATPAAQQSPGHVSAAPPPPGPSARRSH
ncbi:DUF317 domain-containing protein [Streptomyces sp. NPDC059096]|uniref:DUF317 domain-containing protein n=1 Tax=Streptomyces sp. NPDC059096 TaxID=3346727 RepID=UPI00369F4E02